ncbi:MAG: HAD family hydrolase [Candidatus Levyibacteriota bacterium]
MSQLFYPASKSPTLRENVIHNATIRLAEHLWRQSHPTILFDIDGPLLDAKRSINRPVRRIPYHKPLSKLEAAGVSLGVATNRSTQHSISYLRKSGLQLNGPLITEEGQLTIHPNGKVAYLGHASHPDFLVALKKELESHEAFESSWNTAKAKSADGTFAFTFGNYQFQGETRLSIWSPVIEEQEEDVFLHRMEPVVQLTASAYGLVYERDIEMEWKILKKKHINVIGIMGKKDGQPISKGRAAETLSGVWVFVGDGGKGDVEMAIETKSRGGLVIGITEDITTNSSFLDRTDIQLTPEDSLYVYNHAADVLEPISKPVMLNSFQHLLKS